MPQSRYGRHRRQVDIWPGFVDILSNLLLVMIFTLVVYMLSQHFLQRQLTGQSKALEELNRQVSELAELLSLERQANTDLRANIADVSAQLEASLGARDRLTRELAEARDERDALNLQLRDYKAETDSKLAEATETEEKLTDALVRAEAGEDKVRLLLADIEQLKRDIESLRIVRAELEGQVSQMAATLEEREGELTSVREEFTVARDKAQELEARLMTEQERTALAQKDLEERELRLSEMLDLYRSSESELATERNANQRQREQIALLNQQLSALREQLERLEAALDVSDEKAKEQEVVIADLGRRLNLALASKVEELSRYRSEFFGRLREVLGDRKDFTVVGDRFVFQSEVLFQTASADLEEVGKTRLVLFAQVLREVAEKIPQEIPWILQVEGHTDKRPIVGSFRYPSNWELSAARAISVVNFLVAQGIPADRLAATGYGEFQPVEAGDSEEDLRRNRRIELRLTQR
ncbi:MAG: peptidoglycan -binding protein [Alphaproteobacteria bacterium]